ncbi:MAG: DUF177 domain-containing protein [Bacteroidales bacterium]|nr:DUF177 domain-containing protein [Bacteroidales bacterium]
MSLLDDYLIPFYGLKEGIYDYQFSAGDDFFELFENPDIHGGNLTVLLTLYRKNQFLELTFRITGYLNITCDRCLDDFNHPVDVENLLIVRFGEDNEEISDTVLIISRDETRLNIAQYIYEFAALALPVQKIHPEDENGNSECNPEMINRLNNLYPGDKGKNDSITDPRWDILKDLKIKN